MLYAHNDFIVGPGSQLKFFGKTIFLTINEW